MTHISILIIIILSYIFDLFLVSINPIFGIIFTSLLIIFFLTFTVIDFYDFDVQEVLSLVAALFLIILINLFIQSPNDYLNILIDLITLLFIAIIFYLKIPKNRHFLKSSKTKYIYFSLPIGIILGSAIWLSGKFFSMSNNSISLNFAIPIIILAAISETLYFQNLLQNAVADMTDVPIAVAFITIMYGAFHFNFNIFTILVYIFLGFIYSSLYSIWKNIYLIIILNIIINITYYFLTKDILMLLN